MAAGGWCLDEVFKFNSTDELEVSFSRREYTVLEGEESVTVCIQVSGGPLPETVNIDISSSESQDVNRAQGQLKKEIGGSKG